MFAVRDGLLSVANSVISPSASFVSIGFQIYPLFELVYFKRSASLSSQYVSVL